MNYVKTPFREDLVIEKIVTVHYFEYNRDYAFDGEKHDFWEFLYVDKGEVEVQAEDLVYNLKQGEMIFHKPDEFHNVWANGRIAPNLVVISFDCNSPAIGYFEGKILKIGDFEKNLLALILREAKEAYSSPLDTPSLKKLEKKPGSLLGCEQLIRIYLEQMLIFLIRKGKSENNRSKLSTSAKERSDTDLMLRITSYLNANIYNLITFEEVCKFSRLSGTNLKVLFREKAGMGVMEYFRRLKIDEAKKMIREGEDNITGISNKLGYSSIHYFSRHFKKSTGMSPSEYAISVKVKI